MGTEVRNYIGIISQGADPSREGVKGRGEGDLWRTGVHRWGYVHALQGREP